MRVMKLLHVKGGARRPTGIKALASKPPASGQMMSCLYDEDSIVWVSCRRVLRTNSSAVGWSCVQLTLLCGLQRAAINLGRIHRLCTLNRRHGILYFSGPITDKMLKCTPKHTNRQRIASDDEHDKTTTWGHWKAALPSTFVFFD